MTDTSDNYQIITDAVTMTNAMAVAQAPAIAMGILYQANTMAITMATFNAGNAQQHTNIIHQTATSDAVGKMLNDK